MTLGVTESDYQLWRHHPITKIYLQFIADFGATLEREAMERWRVGSLKLVDEQEIRGRVVACTEMAELSFESIRSFYEGEKVEDEAAPS